MVDEFFQRPAMNQLVEQAKNVAADDLEGRLRAVARALVDDGITDRKKEIIALISSGMNQSQVAKQLGVERQAISKALKNMPDRYRFDLSPAT